VLASCAIPPARLSRIGCPFVLIVGEQEPWRPPPHLPQVILQGGGHLLPAEHPAEFSRIVASFWGTVEAR
jgi:pimeloyl-ACP methyl ester carboxylesterase